MLKPTVWYGFSPMCVSKFFFFLNQMSLKMPNHRLPTNMASHQYVFICNILKAETCEKSEQNSLYTYFLLYLHANFKVWSAWTPETRCFTFIWNHSCACVFININILIKFTNGFSLFFSCQFNSDLQGNA